MNLGTSFVEFLQPLAPVFTVPPFNSCQGAGKTGQ